MRWIVAPYGEAFPYVAIRAPIPAGGATFSPT